MANEDGSRHYKSRAEDILADLHQIRNDSGFTYTDGLDALFEALDKAGFFLDPEWEYGYQHVRDDGSSLPVSTTSRTPAGWLNNMGMPFRRRKAIDAGDWEPAGEELTIDLQPRPWLRPGGHPTSYPQENRSHHRETREWTFDPEPAYEQSLERYGYKTAVCGRTGDHWPHGSADLPYCNGVPSEPLR